MNIYQPHCSSSSEECSEGDEGECPNNYSPPKTHRTHCKVCSDPNIFDVSPRFVRQMSTPCDGYRAAMCCRLGSRDPPTLDRLNEVMEKILGPGAYNAFMAKQRNGPSKSVGNTVMIRRIMDILDIKNKVLLQQSELPKVFDKVAMAHVASKYQDVLEAAEAERAGVFDEGEAEEAHIAAEKYQSGVSNEKSPPRPKITVLGYIGCYNEDEQPPEPPEAKPKCNTDE